MSNDVLDLPTMGRIRVRAYEIYVERGSEPGRDLEDWLRAEKELTESYLEFRYMTLSHKQMLQTVSTGRIH
jgi:hypothetical protein